MTGKKLSKKRSDEPHSTYTEAKNLEAKAFFRLGSAQLTMLDYEEAYKAFQQSVASSAKEVGQTIDALTLKRLTESKRLAQQSKRRQKKKFKFAFSAKGNKDDSEKET